MQLTKLTGMSSVLSKLKAYGKSQERSIRRGLVKGGRFLQRKSQEIVPVEFSNLKNSAFTRDIGAISPDIIVGYTADYAVFVHEDLEKKHGKEFNAAYGRIYAEGDKDMYGRKKKAGTREKLRGENQQAKFLERPAREHRAEILGIVYAEAKRV